MEFVRLGRRVNGKKLFGLLCATVSSCYLGSKIVSLEGRTWTNSSESRMSGSRVPAAYIPHGGGPMPLLGEPGHTAMVKWLATFHEKYLSDPAKKPTSILVISAHWEESLPVIQATPSPDLYYDYYGFPKETYNLGYEISSSPGLVKRVDELLTQGNIKHSVDSKRGYDHGVFIPLKLIYPDGPPVPVIQLSLVNSLDPQVHYQIGQALATLREEGVFILGSGMSFHSRSGGNQFSEPFHKYLREALLDSKSEEERRDKVCAWSKAPHAKNCHPREEHLIPLMVVLGTASRPNEPLNNVTEAFYDNILGTKCAGYIFE